jgi:hypothetical protein
MDRYRLKGTRKIDHAFNEQTGLSLYDIFMFQLNSIFC